MQVKDSKAYCSPSCFIKEDILKEKIKKGLAPWAKQQIQEDLSPYKNFTPADIEYFLQHHNSHHNFVRFIIKEGQVTTQKNGIWLYKDRFLNGRNEPYAIIADIIQYVARKGYVKEADFIIGLEDFLTLPEPINIPIITFAKDINIPQEQKFVLMPDWMNLCNSIAAHDKIRSILKKYPWHNKMDKVLWRGGEFDNTGFRKRIVAWSTIHPDIIDAKFVQLKLENESNLAEFYLSPEAHLQYKYLLTMDGSRASWERFVWLLHTNSLIFKQESSHVQWFYKGVLPYQHYMPIKDELDLEKSIAWAMLHPQQAPKIIQNAQAFANQNLDLESMVHYIIELLQAYHKKMQAL